MPIFIEADTLIFSIDYKEKYDFNHYCILIDVATKSDIQNIIFLSQFPSFSPNENSEYSKRHKQIEDYIMQHDWFRYVFIQCSLQYSDLVSWNKNFKDKKKLRGPLGLFTPVTFTSTKNIVDCIEKIIENISYYDLQSK